MSPPRFTDPDTVLDTMAGLVAGAEDVPTETLHEIRDGVGLVPVAEWPDDAGVELNTVQIILSRAIALRNARARLAQLAREGGADA